MHDRTVYTRIAVGISASPRFANSINLPKLHLAAKPTTPFMPTDMNANPLAANQGNGSLATLRLWVITELT